MEKSGQRVLFDLGARLGSLEGYLYSDEKVEKKYLAGWLKNIDQQFKGLSVEIRTEIREDYAVILNKIEALFQRLYGNEGDDTLQLRAMVTSLKGGDV